MRFCFSFFLLCAGAAYASVAPVARKDGVPKPLSAIQFDKGPLTEKLGDQGTLEIPEHFRFVPQRQVPAFFAATHNLPSGRELGVLVSPDFEWFSIFSFSDDGYVKDDEKDKLDADAILKSSRDNTEEANKIRQQRGWGTMEIVGWTVNPHYDDSTHNLEWGMLVKVTPGGSDINYSSRMLGRRGVMKVTLVSGQREFVSNLAAYRRVANSYQYTDENRYASWRPGDKVATYGLSALILGGATAAAAKTGLLKGLWKVIIAGAAGLWKLIVAGFAALGAALRKLFGGRKKAEQE